MSSLKVKSFLYTKLGLKFRMTERIGDFGALVMAYGFGFIIVVTSFFPTQVYEYMTRRSLLALILWEVFYLYSFNRLYDFSSASIMINSIS